MVVNICNVIDSAKGHQDARLCMSAWSELADSRASPKRTDVTTHEWKNAASGQPPRRSMVMVLHVMVARCSR